MLYLLFKHFINIFPHNIIKTYFILFSPQAQVCAFNSLCASGSKVWSSLLEIFCRRDGGTHGTSRGCGLNSHAVSNVLCACDWGTAWIFRCIWKASVCFSQDYAKIYYSRLFPLIPLTSHGKFPFLKIHGTNSDCRFVFFISRRLEDDEAKETGVCLSATSIWHQSSPLTLLSHSLHQKPSADPLTPSAGGCRSLQTKACRPSALPTPVKRRTSAIPTPTPTNRARAKAPMPPPTSDTDPTPGSARTVSGCRWVTFNCRRPMERLLCHNDSTRSGLILSSTSVVAVVVSV